MTNLEMEDRLIDFTILVDKVCAQTKNSHLGKQVILQVIRSSLSPALNYGEAQSAESRKDFIHKLKLSLKELKESKVALKIIYRANLCASKELIVKGLKECSELIAILVSSLNTMNSRPV